MNFIKAITANGQTEIFNLDHVLTIQPDENGLTKIVMAVNFFSRVLTESIEWVNCYNELSVAIKGGK